MDADTEDRRDRGGWTGPRGHRTGGTRRRWRSRRVKRGLHKGTWVVEIEPLPNGYRNQLHRILGGDANSTVSPTILEHVNKDVKARTAKAIKRAEKRAERELRRSGLGG
jgi:hypothetical protein